MPAVKYAVILALKKSSLTQEWTCISVILVTGHTICSASWIWNSWCPTWCYRSKWWWACPACSHL